MFLSWPTRQLPVGTKKPGPWNTSLPKSWKDAMGYAHDFPTYYEGEASSNNEGGVGDLFPSGWDPKDGKIRHPVGSCIPPGLLKTHGGHPKGKYPEGWNPGKSHSWWKHCQGADDVPGDVVVMPPPRGDIDASINPYTTVDAGGHVTRPPGLVDTQPGDLPPGVFDEDDEVVQAPPSSCPGWVQDAAAIVPPRLHAYEPGTDPQTGQPQHMGIRYFHQVMGWHPGNPFHVAAGCAMDYFQRIMFAHPLEGMYDEETGGWINEGQPVSVGGFSYQLTEDNLWDLFWLQGDSWMTPADAWYGYEVYLWLSGFPAGGGPVPPSGLPAGQYRTKGISDIFPGEFPEAYRGVWSSGVFASGAARQNPDVTAWPVPSLCEQAWVRHTARARFPDAVLVENPRMGGMTNQVPAGPGAGPAMFGGGFFPNPAGIPNAQLLIPTPPVPEIAAVTQYQGFAFRG